MRAWLLIFVAGCGSSPRHDIDIVLPSTAQPDQSPMTLAPDTLVYGQNFVGGYDTRSGVAAKIVFEIAQGAHEQCDNFKSPFVVVGKDAKTLLHDTQASGNTQIQSIAGCVDFAALGGDSRDFVDLEIVLTSPVFSGTLVARSP